MSIGVVLCCLAVPAFVVLAERRFQWARAIGGVVLCYVLGVSLGFAFGHPTDAQTVAETAIPLAIPMLLFGVDARAWLKNSRAALVSFGLAVSSVCTMGLASSQVFDIPGVAKMVGMLVGVYTGGTPNMMSVGLALEAPAETFVLLNAADMVLGVGYLVFLLTVGRWVLSKVLHDPNANNELNAEVAGHPQMFSWRRSAISVALAGVALGVSVGLAFALTGAASPIVIFLTLTTLGIGASFHPKIRGLESAAPTANYLILVFCFSIGMISDPVRLLSSPTTFIGLTATMLYGSFITHLVLCKIFRIDVDTAIITSVAAIMGPAFVPPIAARLRHPDSLASGLTTGVIGYALGNYLGIAIGLFLA